MSIIFLIIIVIMFATIFGWQFGSRSLIYSDQNQLRDKLKQHVYKLSHKIGDRSVSKYNNLNAASNYIIQTFESFGYKIELQSFQVTDKTVHNIIATKMGNEKPLENIIIGAHYDTCFNPGADDNASGVAGLLELARLFSEASPSRTIKFIAFVNEEPPFFKTEQMGSLVYAKKARSKNEIIKAVLILEMIGFYSDKPFSQRYPPLFGAFYPNKANFIAVVGNFRFRKLVRQVTQLFKHHSSFPVESVSTFAFVPGIDFSDHWSFWKENYLAIMITDTAFYRNPYYHTQKDTYEKLNYDNMAEIISGLQNVLINLSE